MVWCRCRCGSASRASAAVDDRTCVAYSEILAFLDRAIAWFAGLGVIVERVLTEKGACYLSRAFAHTCIDNNVVHRRTRRYRPQLNAMSARLPPWTWRRRALLRARELLARRGLGMDDIRIPGTMPSGHTGTLMPQRMYFVNDATATLDGEDLGHPARVTPTPDIGCFAVPARGVLAIGQAAWPIVDHDEYSRTRAETFPTAQR